MWDGRVVWPILERLERLDRGSNPRHPTFDNISITNEKLKKKRKVL